MNIVLSLLSLSLCLCLCLLLPPPPPPATHTDTHTVKITWCNKSLTPGCIVSQSCPTLCSSMGCSPPGSSVHGILQARTLEWVAMPSSRESFWPRDQTYISCGSCIAGGFFTTEPQGKLYEAYVITDSVNCILFLCTVLSSSNFLLCSFYFFPFIFTCWRLIALQYYSDFCHTLTWISHGFTCVSHPDPPLPPPAPSHPSGSSQCTSPEHLSHASNLGWWSVSPLIVYLFQCCSLWTSHPRLLP